MSKWEGDWRGRVLARVRERGAKSLTELARRYPQKTLRELAQELDALVAQLERVLTREAWDTDSFDELARSLLVRELRQAIPQGWGVGDNSEANLANGLAHWAGALSSAFISQTSAVFDALYENAPPKGWLPDGPDDPLIVQCFKNVSFKLADANLSERQKQRR